jgi:hypothetical protein
MEENKERRAGAMLKSRKGSALIIAVVMMVVVIALGGAWLMLSDINAKEATIREFKLVSHYIADSGIQVALAQLVSDSPPTIPFKHGETGLCGGDYTVAVEDIGNDYYKITSYSEYMKVDSSIEVVVKKTTPDFDLDAAFAVQINPNAEVTSDTGGITIDVDGANGTLKGQDHDPDGNLLADQTNATWAASLNTLVREATQGASGVTDFLLAALDPAAQFVGTPASTANDRPFIGPTVDMIVDFVRNSPDTVVNITKKGGQNFTSNDGSFGSATDYKAVYVNASSTGGDLSFAGSFHGYGLLVIEAEEGEEINFSMGGQAVWHGLIVYKKCGEYLAPKGDAINLVGGGSPAKSPHIAGGAIFYAAGNKVELDKGANPLRIRGQSRIYYSSEAINLAMKAAATPSYNTVSYRIIQ